MSGGTRCKDHGVEHYAVVCAFHNHSAFNGYRTTPSEYSEVRCTAPSVRSPDQPCGARWRTTADYVLTLPTDKSSYACPHVREELRRQKQSEQPADAATF